MKRHEFKEISISNFLKKINNKNNLLFKNMCGEIQRKIDIDHLNELIQYQKKYHEKYNEFIFPNPIILCKINDKFAIIDGQHRIQCIKTLFNEYNIDFNILLSIINIDDNNYLSFGSLPITIAGDDSFNINVNYGTEAELVELIESLVN